MVFFTMKKYSHTNVTCASPIIFYPIPDAQRAEGICTQCNAGRSCTMVLSHWPATVHDAHCHPNGSFPSCRAKRCLSLVINVFVATERHICPPPAHDFLAGGFLHSCFRNHCACSLFSLVNHLLLRVFVARTNFSPTMTCPERSGVWWCVIVCKSVGKVYPHEERLEAKCFMLVVNQTRRKTKELVPWKETLNTNHDQQSKKDPLNLKYINIC